MFFFFFSLLILYTSCRADVLYSWISNALLGCFRCFYICLLSLMLHHLPDRPFFVPLYGRLKFSPRKRTKQGLQRAWGPISCPAPNHAKATPVTARPQNATLCPTATNKNCEYLDATISHRRAMRPTVNISVLILYFS